MSALKLPRPTISQLEQLEGHLRIVYAKLGHVPKKVKAARDHNELGVAWRGEALRYYYLVVARGYDPAYPPTDNRGLLDQHGNPIG